jgi:hypothetical protein
MSFYQPIAPAGIDGQVQFNNQRGFGATSDLRWDASGRKLDVERLEAFSLLSLSSNNRYRRPAVVWRWSSGIRHHAAWHRAT